MTRRDEAGDDDEPGGTQSRMLARTWTIAANYRSPSDYGIPTAPTFEAKQHTDGTLLLFDDEHWKFLLSARRARPVRR